MFVATRVRGVRDFRRFAEGLACVGADVGSVKAGVVITWLDSGVGSATDGEAGAQ